MTATVQLADRLSRAIAGFGVVWLAARWRAPRLGDVERRRLAGALARRTLARLDVHPRVTGRGFTPGGPCLLVVNHVSWLDVQVLNAVFDARFVAKSETAAWPVVGAIARGFGTFFLRRGSIRDAARVVGRVTAAIARGETVAVFPEGTTTDGLRLGRFHPAFFQAAIDAGVPVHPVAIRYRRPDGTISTAAPFVGDMTFLASLLRIAREPALTAELSLCPPLATIGRDRRQLAATAQHAVARSLDLAASAVDAPVPPRRRARRLDRAA
jgi:1-acyl-sn-glycerol-3-phosphate acyltransferase